MARYRNIRFAGSVDATQVRTTTKLVTPFGLVVAHPNDWLLTLDSGRIIALSDVEFKNSYAYGPSTRATTPALPMTPTTSKSKSRKKRK
jgi:hypothetical protein